MARAWQAEKEERTAERFSPDLPKKKLLRPDEVAHLLGVNVRTVYRMVADGRLPKASIPARIIRIQKEAVQRMLEDEDGIFF